MINSKIDIIIQCKGGGPKSFEWVDKWGIEIKFLN